MPTLLGRVVREVFRREALSSRALWWFAAEGTLDWYDLLASELAPHLGGVEGSRRVVAALVGRVFQRRFQKLADARQLPAKAPDGRAVALLFAGLYRLSSSPRSAWILDSVGGAPQSYDELVASERWMEKMSPEQRWHEVTHHLGEVLVALTEGLPTHMDRSRPIVGDLCFAAGQRVGKKMKKAFDLDDSPASALEVLRMSEYVFRVNPEHWGENDGAKKTGWLEGTACPWFDAPGWNGAHCGIFGQFQSGICHVFGLRYHLTTTIPKHGGSTCRIDVKPIVLRRKGAAEASP